MHFYRNLNNFGSEERFGPLLPFVGGLVVGGLFAPNKGGMGSNTHNQPAYGPVYYPVPAPYYQPPYPPTAPGANPIYIDPTNVYVDQLYQTGPVTAPPPTSYFGPYIS